MKDDVKKIDDGEVTESIKSDSQTRKWQITINNPKEKGYTHDEIKAIANSFKGLVYMCMSDEVGAEGTYHTHIYLQFANAKRFSTIKNAFYGGHFEMCKGSASQNRDYVFKQGKWAGNKKEGTNLPDTHYESGDLPVERQGKRTDLDDLYDMINSGMDNYQIIAENPAYMLNIDKIDRVRQLLKEKEFKEKWRNVEVTYIFGSPGSGKTRSVMEEYGYTSVYRVTDYLHPFDNYCGQDIILFDEFRSNIPLSTMLPLLEGYPVELPCRYNNKVACFTKVYICSNIALERQYEDIQRREKESFNAFIRRIKTVKKFSQFEVTEYTANEYMERWEECIRSPFLRKKA